MTPKMTLLLLVAAATTPLHAAQQQAPTYRNDPSADPAPSPFVDGAQLDRIARARANLEGLIGGTIAIGALTEAELLDVLELERQRRERDRERDTRTPEKRCVDREIGRFNVRPSALERRVIDLKCRESLG